MRKSLILEAGLILLVIVAGFVVAVRTDRYLEGYGNINGDFVEGSFYVYDGWNLVYGLASPDWINGGEVSKEYIKAIYLYDRLNKEYIRFYPNPDPKIAETKEVVYQGVFWVYVYMPRGNRKQLTYSAIDLRDEFVDNVRFPLLEGWNFISVVEGMIGKKMNGEEFRGNCEIIRNYAWGQREQKWVDLIEINRAYEEEVFVQNTLGAGLAIKVKNDCIMGIVENIPGVVPPAVPQ